MFIELHNSFYIIICPQTVGSNQLKKANMYIHATHTGFHIHTLVTVAAMRDQGDVSSYVNSNAFEVGEVVAFRGTDRLPFNLLRVTHNVSLRSLVPRSRVRWNLLRLHEMMTTFAIL